MNTVLDLFGNFSELENGQKTSLLYLQLLTETLIQNNSLDEEVLRKNIKNNIWALRNHGDDALADELSTLMHNMGL